MYEILYFLLMIGLNILINYLYRKNIVFPILFVVFEIIYALSIVTIDELYVVFLLSFSIIYNLLIIIELKE